MSFEIPFSHIAEIIMGQSPKGEEVNNEGIGLPLLNGPTEFTDRYPVPVQHTAYAKKTSLPGDVLFCVRGSTTGRMNYSDQKYCIGRGLAAIRGRNGYPTPYVKAVLETCLPELLAAATGSTFPNVSKDLINNIPVNILPVENACNISKLIELQEDKVFTNNQINQTLEQMAQALFKSWFVDFEPVKAKIAVLEAGGSQEDATLAAMTAITGKDADVLAVFEREHPEQYADLKATVELFPCTMQHSELGEIPEGWNIGKFGDILEFNPRRILKKGNIASYLDMKNVPVTGHSAQEIIDREFNSGTKFINGDTLLARITPCLENGKTAYVDFLPADEIVGWGSTEFIVMRSKKNLPLSLSYFFARLNSFRTIAIQSMQGTSGRQRADASVLEQHVWIVPPNEILQKFGAISDLILGGNRSRNIENKSLVQLRDTLLPKLLSGEITLPEAEQAVSEAENV